MYNRYIRNDDGVYARQPQKEAEPLRQDPPQPPPPCADPPPPPRGSGQIPFLSGIMEKLHLGSVDFGDLLLLLLLFQLFREDGDDELLIAIGLLLIL
jgi:hypothetical protein